MCIKGGICITLFQTVLFWASCNEQTTQNKQTSEEEKMCIFNIHRCQCLNYILRFPLFFLWPFHFTLCAHIILCLNSHVYGKIFDVNNQLVFFMNVVGYSWFFVLFYVHFIKNFLYLRFYYEKDMCYSPNENWSIISF